MSSPRRAGRALGLCDHSRPPCSRPAWPSLTTVKLPSSPDSGDGEDLLREDVDPLCPEKSVTKKAVCVRHVVGTRWQHLSKGCTNNSWQVGAGVLPGALGSRTDRRQRCSGYVGESANCRVKRASCGGCTWGQERGEASTAVTPSGSLVGGEAVQAFPCPCPLPGGVAPAGPHAAPVTVQ